MIFDAFHLSALDSSSIHEWANEVVEGTDHSIRWPRLTPQQVALIAQRARSAGAALRAKPVAGIIRIIDAAVASMFDDAATRTLLTDLVSASSGYSMPMTQVVLQRMQTDWRESALQTLVHAEVGDAAALDGFHATDGRMRLAAGPGLALHIFAGNVPGVAVTSLIRGLLVKAPALGKTAAGEKILAPAFARALAAIAPELQDALAITYWEGGTVELEAAALEHADTVIHYGGQDAIEDMRVRTPAGVRIVEHGPRISFGIVDRSRLSTDGAAPLAEEVAQAVATFDQQGCVSPHVIFVEDGGATTPRDFASLVADALASLERVLPPGRVATAEANAIRQARDRAEFRSIAGRDTTLWSSGMPGYTVIYDAQAELTPSCLNRTITIHPVPSLEDVLPILTPYRHVLQSAAIAADPGGDASPGEDPGRFSALAAKLAHAGVTRITTFAEMPWPPPTWHHDGRGPLIELIRWTDVEA
jgi:hypothetical protein